MGDHLGSLGTQLVAHRYRTDDLPGVFDEDGGGARLLHPRDITGEGPGVEPPGPAQPDDVPVATPGEPRTGHGLDIGGRDDIVDRGQDRRGQRVLAARLQGRRQIQHLLARRTIGGDHVDDRGPVRGERAGLVQGNATYLAQPFQRRAALDQRTQLAGRADGSHYGDRHRDRQRTR